MIVRSTVHATIAHSSTSYDRSYFNRLYRLLTYGFTYITSSHSIPTMRNQEEERQPEARRTSRRPMLSESRRIVLPYVYGDGKAVQKYFCLHYTYYTPRR